MERGSSRRAATPVAGGPQHVLLAPNGRILAYLYPDRGINLDAYVGRPMGIVGSRAVPARTAGDLIVVRGMVPVRLVAIQGGCGTRPDDCVHATSGLRFFRDGLKADAFLPRSPLAEADDEDAVTRAAAGQSQM